MKKNKKIKILFFLPNFNMGGAEKVTINMIRLLDKKQFDIHLLVLINDGPLSKLLPEYISIHTLNVSKAIFSIFKLRKILLHLMPDIIFSTLFRTNIVLDLALIGIQNKPITILRNPTSPKLVIAEKSLSRIMLFLLKKAYRRATIILAQTPEMKEEMIEYFVLNKKNIQVFINPLDYQSIDNAIKNCANPFEKNHINIVMVGRLHKVKGIDTMLYALSIIIKKNKNFFLHIVGGDVGEKKNLTKLISNLSLEKYVKFWGEQSNPYKFIYFSDMYVLSSIREGLPNTVLESLYLDKPVITTRCVPFLSELINDGENGFLVDVGNEKQLAESILKYRKINTTSKMVFPYETDVNKLFLSALNQKENINE